MQARVDGNGVFVCADDFVNLQESDAVFGDMQDFAVAAFTAMVTEGIEKASIYVNPERLDYKTLSALMRPGKVARVTIEWVDAAEAEPDIEARFVPARV